MTDKRNNKSKFTVFLQKHAISLVIFALSIVASLVIYFMGIEKPKLCYIVHPVKTAVVNKNATSRISVYYDGKVINSNVSIAQIEIWNGGRKPIRNDDILSQPTVCIEDSTSILEAKILKVSRRETGIEIDTLAINKGIVNIGWAILEKNDGAILQLTYKGDIEKKIVASAAVVKQKKIIEVKASSDKVSYNKTSKYLSLLFTMILNLAVIIFNVRALIKNKHDLSFRIFLLVGSIILMGFFSIAVISLFKTLSTNLPPIRF